VDDAIVIGAGPAGSFSALLLARAGWQVTLLEQHAFPRDKVCGECLSSRGIDILKQHHLYDPLCQSRPVSLPKVQLHGTTGRRVSLDLPRPMMGVSRQLLDGFLLNAAVAAGASVRHRVRCEGVEATAIPSLRVRDLMTNQMETLSASHVFIADGKGSLAGIAPRPTGDFGIKSHFMNVDGPRDAIEMFGCADCYGGIAAIENDRWNVSFTVSKTHLAAVGNRLDDLFAQLAGQNPALRQRMQQARRVSPWIASPVPRYGKLPEVASAIHRVGNGSAAMEPICGEGMGVALRSAELAVASILRRRSGIAAITTALRANTHGAAWRWRRAACRAAGFIASSPPASRAALAAVRDLRLGPVVLRLAGKN
jgi:flavin-dependent dehydrogenase